MKKLNLVLALMLIISTSAFSTIVDESLTLQFLNYNINTFETWKYNRDETPVKIESIDSEIASLKKANINYRYKKYEVTSTKLQLTESNGIYQEKGKAKKFIKYVTYVKDGRTYLEVLFGDVSW